MGRFGLHLPSSRHYPRRRRGWLVVRICREEIQPALVPFIDRIALDKGLEQTVAWYRENEGWWKALRTRDSVSSS